jgi:crossover junction endodeoxyribonuclease RuvC
MGIDPGTALLGYGVIDGTTPPQAVAFGVIETTNQSPMAERLFHLHAGIHELLDRYQPDVVAVEQLFFARNVTTAIAVGQARGVVLLAAAQAGVPVLEYTPAEIKQAVAGYGKADKPQMQEMVRLILGLDREPQPDDSADALAVAICHAQTAPFLSKVHAEQRGSEDS